MQHPILHIDMDDTIAEYSKAIDLELRRNPGISFPQSQIDFFRNLEPKVGSVEAINDLKNLGFDIYILTCPSPLNPLSYMEKRIWVEKYLGYSFVEKTIMTMNKGIVKGNFLVDDWIEGRGQEDFEGELIHFGSPKFPSWKEVIAYLSMKLANEYR
jgi:5'-nucleotidase